MEPSQFDLGAVFRWAHDDRPMRILMHDDEVVMYDAWWPHLEAWGMTDLGDLCPNGAAHGWGARDSPA